MNIWNHQFSKIPTEKWKINDFFIYSFCINVTFIFIILSLDYFHIPNCCTHSKIPNLSFKIKYSRQVKNKCSIVVLNVSCNYANIEWKFGQKSFTALLWNRTSNLFNLFVTSKKRNHEFTNLRIKSAAKCLSSCHICRHPTLGALILNHLQLASS